MCEKFQIPQVDCSKGGDRHTMFQVSRSSQRAQFDYSEHALMSILVGEKLAMKISYVGWD